MQRKKQLIGLAALAGVAFVAGRLSVDFSNDAAASASFAQQDQQAAGGQQEMSPEMQEWMALGQPGEHHKNLETLLGDWTANVSVWETPGSEPMTMNGNVTREWIMDGRFVQEDVSGSMPGGGAFNALGLYGYNNVTQQYESGWIENMSTGLYKETGWYDSDSKTFHFQGQHVEPGGKVAFSTSQMDVSNPDRHVATAWALDDEGVRYKLMEIVFERKE